MTFDVFWPFLTYLPTVSRQFLYYNIRYLGSFFGPPTNHKIGRRLWTFPKAMWSLTSRDYCVLDSQCMVDTMLIFHIKKTRHHLATFDLNIVNWFLSYFFLPYSYPKQHFTLIWKPKNWPPTSRFIRTMDKIICNHA